MLIALIVTSSVLLLIIIFLIFLLVRATKRLLQYDEVFQYISGDIQTNLRQFQKMNKSSVLSNDKQIESAHKNMMLMAQRLNEILLQMEEVSGKRYRREPLGPPPQVV